MRATLAIVSALTLALVVGCGSDPSSDGDDSAPADSTAKTAEAAQFEGVYSVTGKSYSWASFHDGRYALWKAGSTCNADFAKAPDSCLESGTFKTNAAAKTMTLTNDDTGKTTKTTYEPESTGSGGVAVKDTSLGQVGTSLGQIGTSLGSSSGGSSIGSSGNPLMMVAQVAQIGAMVFSAICQAEQQADQQKQADQAAAQAAAIAAAAAAGQPAPVFPPPPVQSATSC